MLPSQAQVTYTHHNLASKALHTLTSQAQVTHRHICIENNKTTT